MNLIDLQNFFVNFSFIVLFFAMLFYWTYLNKYGIWAVFLANLSIAFFLLLRWNQSGHFPLSNLYESLVFLSWALTLIHLILNQQLKTQSILLGAVLVPIALFVNVFASFTLPDEMRNITPLVPALQSNWLIMHVTVMMLSYASLFAGCLFAIAFLILQTKSLVQPKITKNSLIFDNLSYRTLGFGFPLLTIGILSGAVWANEAWGSYWSWDPKETWALITWIIFAIYFHTRLTLGWRGEKSAIVAVAGFFVVWICYLGVNLIGKGLHSYGFLN